MVPSSRLLAAAALLVGVVLAGPTRADLPDDLACGEARPDCLAFLGLASDDGAFSEPQPGGPKKTYVIGGRPHELDAHTAWREMRCLAYTAWAEARGEGRQGMEAIMWVVINRANSGRYPASLCKVVAQRAQFEALRKGAVRPVLAAAKSQQQVPEPRLKAGPDKDAALVAKALAWHLVMDDGSLGTEDPTDGATHFLAPAAQENMGRTLPEWADAFIVTLVHKGHKFFRMPDEVAAAAP